VQAYLYDGYWEDIGTIEAFYNANLGITKKPVPDFRYGLHMCTVKKLGGCFFFLDPLPTSSDQTFFVQLL